VPDGVPDGRAGRGRSDGGQDERLPNLHFQIMVPDRGARWGDEWQNLKMKIKMSGGRANGGGEDVQRAEWNARRGAGRGARRGQIEYPMEAMSSAMSFLNAMSPV
jgi:hypothetical protein